MGIRGRPTLKQNPLTARKAITSASFTAGIEEGVMRIILPLLLAILCAQPLQAAELSLSAAASLKEVVNELTGRYAARNPAVTFVRNYGGSGQLAKQIEQGAPVDLFISANDQWMGYLATRSVIDGKSVATFAYNVLVFVGRPGLNVAGMRDVATLSRIALGSPKSVPAGEYAMEALTKAGIDRQLHKKLVMARDVRECLMYADRGEVDGAFVYRTDAGQMARHVAVQFTVPQQLYPRVRYPMALTLSGARKPEAVAFLSFLKSPEAAAVLTKHGFLVK
jgi:molybdate transport system substrate-binding protein